MNLVDRPRLTARLRAAISSFALTCVTAPLGAGKSAGLQLAFAADAGYAPFDAEVWHRPEFVAELVAAVRVRRADFGRLTLGALVTGVAADALGRTFARDLNHVDAKLIIAIDNAHVLAADPAFGAFVNGALGELPDSVRLVLSGRTPLDGMFAEALAQRRATLIGNDALRFDRDEIAALASGLGRELSADDTSAIAASTDGWAAGIVLALASPPDRVPDLASPEAAAAYLEAALFPGLEPAALLFLETTAVFETLDVAQLERLPEFAGARAIVAALERGGAPLTSLGAGRYRVHPALRAIALRRLAARGGTAGAHAAAVAVCVAARAIAAALYHVVTSEDAVLAGAFLREHAVAALATGDRTRLRAAVALIDEAGADTDVAAFVRGLDEKAVGSPQARASFENAVAAAGVTGDAAIGFAARAQLVEHDLGRLRVVDSAELAGLRLAAAGLGQQAHATAEMLCGWAEAIAFDFRAAHDRVAPLARTGDPAQRFNTGILLAYAQTALGETAAAAETLDDLVRLLEDDDRIVLQILALVWFARLGLAWGTTSAADDAAAQAQRLAGVLDFRAEEAALYGVAAELASHRGDAGATLAFAQRAHDRAPDAWYVADTPRIRAFAAIGAARAAFLNADLVTAHMLAQRAGESAGTPAPMRALAFAEAAVYALLYDPRSAAGAIDAAHAAAAAAVPLDVGDVVVLTTAGDILAFLAAANGATIGQRFPLPGPFDALVAARRGLVTLEFAGIAVGNARRGTGSADAIVTALERITAAGPRYEVRLAAAYAAKFVRPPKPRANIPAAPELTAREREILALLVDGLTNREIAQRIVVSPRTVETHVERVLSKLEVGSRSRAIAKALRLGLVELPA